MRVLLSPVDSSVPPEVVAVVGIAFLVAVAAILGHWFLVERHK